MMTKSIHSKHGAGKLLMCCAMVTSLLTVSCKKSNSGGSDDSGGSTVTTKVYHLNNLVADSSATYSNGAQPFYYSLETNKIIPSSQAQTSNWDLCFNSTYNSNVCANNGAISTSPGYGGPGKGQIYMVINPAIDTTYYAGEALPIKMIPARTLFDQAFAAVKTASVADGNWVKSGVVGLDYFENSLPGWAYYDFSGALFPDKPSSLVAHVAYALPRTFIVKTAKGLFAKVQIYSFYKDAPEVPDRSYKAGFITMVYAIQTDGSMNLDITE